LAAKGERTGVGSWSGLGSGAEASQLLLPNTLSLSSIVTAIANIPLLRNRYDQTHRSSSVIKRGQSVDAESCRWSKAAAKQQRRRQRRRRQAAADDRPKAQRREKTLHNKTTNNKRKNVSHVKQITEELIPLQHRTEKRFCFFLKHGPCGRVPHLPIAT